MKHLVTKVVIGAMALIMCYGNPVSVAASSNTCRHPSTTTYTYRREVTRACSTHEDCTLQLIYADTHVVCTVCGKDINFITELKQEIHNFH